MGEGVRVRVWGGGDIQRTPTHPNNT